MSGKVCIAPHARPKIPRLSDVENLALFAVHPVDARASVQSLGVMLNAFDAAKARRSIGAEILNYVHGNRHLAFASQPPGLAFQGFASMISVRSMHFNCARQHRALNWMRCGKPC